MVRQRSGKNSRMIKVPTKNYDPDGPDFGSGSGGSFFKPGKYKFKLKSATAKISKNDSEMVEWVFVGIEGAAKGKSLYYYTVLDDEQKLGRTLEAVGVEPGPDAEFDPDEIEGAEVLGIVATEQYLGEDRSKLQRIVPLEAAAGGEEEEEEEEKPARRGKRGNGKAKVTKLSEDEIKELDEEELESLVEKHELEVDLSKSKTLTRKINAVIEAMTDKNLIA